MNKCPVCGAEKPNLEIERRFILDQLPCIKYDAAYNIFQGYIGTPGVNEVRIRESTQTSDLTATEWTMATKVGTGLAREEREVSITKEQFSMLSPLTTYKTIRKVRHVTLIEPDLKAEIDQFHVMKRENGELLVVLEVELPTPDYPLMEALPGYILSHIEKEVTGIPEWSNSSMAENGIPEPDPSPLHFLPPVVRKSSRREFECQPRK